jgi:hypothetical protein
MGVNNSMPAGTILTPKPMNNKKGVARSFSQAIDKLSPLGYDGDILEQKVPWSVTFNNHEQRVETEDGDDLRKT